MCMGVVKKKSKKKKKRCSIAGIEPMISRLVSYPLGHQGSWAFYERLCSYSFVKRVNYDTQIKHSACKGLKATIHWATLLPATRQQSCQQQSYLVDVACCPLLATKKLVASNRKNVARKLNMFNFWQQSCPNIKGRQHATSTGQLCCDNFVACCWQQSCLVDGGLKK